jgi:PAS domain S-box-containing protein
MEHDAILDLVDDAVIVFATTGEIRLWNASAARMYGVPADGAIGQNLHHLLSGHHLFGIDVLMTTLAAEGRWEGEMRRTTAVGRAITVEVVWTLHPSGEIVEVGRDLGQLSQLEQETRAAAHRYRNIFQAMAASFWELDFSAVRAMIGALFASGVTDLRAYFRDHPEWIDTALKSTRVVDVNEATLRMFGAAAPEDLLGRDIAFAWPLESRGLYAEALMAAVERRDKLAAETVLTALDGRRIDALFTVCWPTEHQARGNVLVGVIDITDRIAAQVQLEQTRADFAHASRVATLGELTASIAHEVNQPLTAIAIGGETALRWLSRPEPDMNEVRDLAGRIVADARRAADIISRIRDMARNQAPQHARLSVAGVVREAVAFLEAELRYRNVALHLDLDAGLPLVLCDRIQIQQVIANLVVNATQAMTEAQTPSPSIWITAAPMPEQVRIIVHDNGPGLPQSGADRLFQGFVSTKRGGLGIGLSICRTIVDAHGGAISAHTGPEGGACFAFTLRTENAA